MQNTEETQMYKEIDLFNFHEYIAFGFDYRHVEDTVFKLLEEQFNPDLVDENYFDLADEIYAQFTRAFGELKNMH